MTERKGDHGPCRKPGTDTIADIGTCWRFIRGKPDLLIALLDEQNKNWTTENATLTTWDYKALDRQIGATGKHLHDLLDWSTPTSMDRSLYCLTSHITKLLQEKARAQGEHVPAAPIERHLSFIQTELGLGPINAVTGIAERLL